MSVPQYWWLGMLGQNLHQDFPHLHLEDTNILLMKIDDINEQEMYPVRWDTVVKYVDVDAGTFSGYRLHAEFVGKKYIQTKPEEWTKVNNTNGRNVNAIPFTSNDVDFPLLILHL